MTPAAFVPALLLLAVLFSGCVVSFVAPYDPVFDQGISQTHMETNAFLGRMATSGGGYEANRRFYEEMQGRVAALRSRAELYGAEKNKGTLSLLDQLAAQFENLRELHEAGPLTGDTGRHARELINSNFRSLLQVELAKKRSSGVTKPS